MHDGLQALKHGHMGFRYHALMPQAAHLGYLERLILCNTLGLGAWQLLHWPSWDPSIMHMMLACTVSDSQLLASKQGRETRNWDRPQARLAYLSQRKKEVCAGHKPSLVTCYEPAHMLRVFVTFTLLNTLFINMMQQKRLDLIILPRRGPCLQCCKLGCTIPCCHKEDS